jgi:integrase
VQALYDLYRTHQEKTLRSWSEVRRIMEREVLPVWRHRRVVDLRRRDIRELVERKARTAPIQANRVLQRISAMLSFAMDHDWIESNPAWRIKKPGRERSRDRVLTREELRELWAALHETDAENGEGTPKPRLSQALNDVFLVMLLTAQRCGEVCQMQWSEVDLTTGWWAIPGEVSKNQDPHRVPLTAMRLIRFGGHLPKGEYDGHHDGAQGPTDTAELHRGLQGRGRPARAGRRQDSRGGRARSRADGVIAAQLG